MRNYLALYIGCALSGETKVSSEISQQEGLKAWENWMVENAANIVDLGGPLGRTLRVSEKGIANHSNLLNGYIIVKAESHENAALLFKNHPHFSMFPGDSVEIIECTEIPNMGK